jgi:hypothetical protein
MVRSDKREKLLPLFQGRKIRIMIIIQLSVDREEVRTVDRKILGSFSQDHGNFQY